MSKLDDLKILKRTKARTNHLCSKCGAVVNVNDFYYTEALKDKFLQSLHGKKYCEKCYTDIAK
jgi:hypothetical protein